MSVTGPRVLYLTAGFPFPLSSGYLRHFHLMRQLAPNHHLHLMSLVGPSFESPHATALSTMVDQISTFPKAPPTDRVQRAVHLLHPARPDSASKALAKAVDDQIRGGGVDVVFLSGKETFAAAEIIAGRVPLVVDLCDATSHRITQEIEVARWTRRSALTIRRAGIRQIEHRLIALADALITASERDRTSLRAEGAPVAVTTAQVIPNGIDVDHWRRTTRRLGGAVVFCGNLGYGPNADAAHRLVCDVMPLVWEQRPEAEVLIIGTGASDKLAAALAGPRVTLTGTVDDVRPHLERGAVFAAPLRVASGIQNKLLEALSMEIPVVTSAAAAAGLGCNGDVPPLTVATTDADHAAGIVAHLEVSSAKGAEPDQRARDWVTERFSWERSGAILAGVLEDVLDRRTLTC